MTDSTQKNVKTTFRSTFTFMGKQYERTSTKSQREANRKADRLQKDLEDGNIGISKQMRVSSWGHEWLETYKKPCATEKSYKNDKRFVDNLIVPQIGGLRLSEVKDVHLTLAALTQITQVVF